MTNSALWKGEYYRFIDEVLRGEQQQFRSTADMIGKE